MKASWRSMDGKPTRHSFDPLRRRLLGGSSIVGTIRKEVTHEKDVY
jgi:hypothetical protein